MYFILKKTHTKNSIAKSGEVGNPKDKYTPIFNLWIRLQPKFHPRICMTLWSGGATATSAGTWWLWQKWGNTGIGSWSGPAPSHNNGGANSGSNRSPWGLPLATAGENPACLACRWGTLYSLWPHPISSSWWEACLAGTAGRGDATGVLDCPVHLEHVHWVSLFTNVYAIVHYSYLHTCFGIINLQPWFLFYLFNFFWMTSCNSLQFISKNHNLHNLPVSIVAMQKTSTGN